MNISLSYQEQLTQVYVLVEIPTNTESNDDGMHEVPSFKTIRTQPQFSRQNK
jgi:hypothetical protein